MSKKKAGESLLERGLAFQIEAYKLPEPEREYPFAGMHVGIGPGIRERLSQAGLKNWRFDFAWPSMRFAVEVEGGAFKRVGGHTSGVGFTEDILKYHHAMRLGWTIYRCDANLIKNGSAVELIEQLLAGFKNENN